MSKTLCKVKKSKKSNKQSFFEFPDATHVCRKCSRIANSKKKLCKPQKLSFDV